MITPILIDRFVAGTKGQALREGTRYAQEARVSAFVGSPRSATTVVRGKTGDFEVVLWSQDGGLAHRCTCPSWRDPCKHEIAAALSLRQSLAPAPQETKRASAVEKPDEARRRALEERIVAARREKMHVKAVEPPQVAVTSGSGFSYMVHLRGGVEGPHSCDCPDFEANRLHTCKHVERVRTRLHSSRSTIPVAHRRGAATPRIYLHFGEVVEPRLFGRPRGPGSRAVLQAFDEAGLPLRPLARDLSELRRWLSGFGTWVEPQALAWLDDRIERRPRLPGRELARLVPPSGLKPYPYQWTGAKFLATTGRALLADEMGLGKGLAHGTGVLTPAGWRSVESLTVGDQVIGSDGHPHRLSGVYHRGRLPVFRVRFSDGASLRVDADHLWAVRHVRNDWRGSSRTRLVLDTAALATKLRDGAGNETWRIPLVEPVRFSARALPIEPYLLGILLGDGSLSLHGGRFATADAEIAQAVVACAGSGLRARGLGGYDYGVVSPRPGAPNVLRRNLDALGLRAVSEDKHIPEEYLLASVEQRLALLRGLMDTDGTVQPDGTTQFTTTSPRLADGVEELIRSLGGVARRSTKRPWYSHLGERRAGRLAVTLTIAMPVSPFRLARKADAWSPRGKYRPTRIIQSIQEDGEAEVTCIAVNAPDRLFVAEGYVVTHNTVQALLAAAALYEATPAARHVTVVCPASLRGGWQDEIRRWLGEDAVPLEGGTLDRARVIASRPRWLITHYEQVLRDHEEHAAHPPDLLIVDEAQRAKGLRTRTARVLKSIPSRYLFALTGTPLENRLEEAYAIAQLIDQRLLPPLWQIDRDHFVRDDKGRRVVLYRNLDALRAHLAPAFLRRRKEDVLPELPGRVRSTVMVPMHPAVVTTYDDVMFQVARIANKKVILPADLERMQRLLVIARRCCNGPHMLGLDASSRSDRSVPKLAELEQILRDLCLGEKRKAVVFSEWTDMTERVESLCRRLGLATFHLRGDVPVRKRPALIRAFAEAEGPAVFISTDAGGVGLNLQAADAVVNLDLPWNPARLEQRIARVHRIGSRRTVQEILTVCKESVEERILALHDTKRKVLESIWSRHGEDVIAAPGGSGAFREMVQALLRTHAPGGASVAEPPVPAEEAVAEPDGRPEELEPGAQAGDHLEEEAISTGPPQPQIAPSPAEGPLPPPGVDPVAVAAAVAAVAPTLPLDHRRSLASVFRAIAEALEA